MRITHMKTNHIQNPLVFSLGKPVLTWIVDYTPDKKQSIAQVIISKDKAFSHSAQPCSHATPERDKKLDEINRVLSKFPIKKDNK